MRAQPPESSTAVTASLGVAACARTRSTSEARRAHRPDVSFSTTAREMVEKKSIASASTVTVACAATDSVCFAVSHAVRSRPIARALSDRSKRCRRFTSFTTCARSFVSTSRPPRPSSVALARTASAPPPPCAPPLPSGETSTSDT
eukprot:2501106-Prymnesium_polylepis.1